MSTPIILAVLFTNGIVSSSSGSPSSSISDASSSTKLPNINSPAAPCPSPPNNSNLGKPQSNTFPPLHLILSKSSP